jgi:hypothetical protein
MQCGWFRVWRKTRICSAKRASGQPEQINPRRKLISRRYNDLAPPNTQLGLTPPALDVLRSLSLSMADRHFPELTTPTSFADVDSLSDLLCAIA